MRIEQTTEQGCAIVTLHGRLDLPAIPRLRRLLHKLLAERPVAVICDLSGLHAVDPACATSFATVATHPTSRWPGTSLLLCAARPEVAAVLDRLRLRQFLPIHPTLEAALAHAGSRPPWLREELPLALSLAAPAAARRFVRDLCHQWRLDQPDDPDEPAERARAEELVDQAVLLASELVTNAVLHADAAGDGASNGLRLLVELRGHRLHLGVADAASYRLHLVSPPAQDLEAEHGRGLLMVERLATAWGAHPLSAGGKMVWCVLTVP